MKAILLHGDDIVKSHQRLQKFIETARSRGWEILYDQISLTPSLFGQDRLTIIRDLRLVDNKTISKAVGTLIIYYEGLAGKNFIKSLPKDLIIEEFKLPKLIWNFLEKMVPGKSEKIVYDLHKIIEKEPPEFIFYLIAKQFRDLYWVKKDAASSGFNNWKIGKLKNQANKFSEDLLKKIINYLSNLDYEVKIGKSELVSSLDLFILKLLK